MNWKTLYKFAKEEPIQEAFIELRLWLGFLILPKPVRDLAKPLLDTTSKLLGQQTNKKNLSINITVSSDDGKN